MGKKKNEKRNSHDVVPDMEKIEVETCFVCVI